MAVQKTRIAVITVTFQSSRVLHRMLSSLFSLPLQECFELRVVVADNSGDPDEVAEVRKILARHPAHRIDLLKLDQNVGFAAANNAGANFAQLAGVDTLVFVNPDVEFVGGSLSSFIAEGLDKNLGYFGLPIGIHGHREGRAGTPSLNLASGRSVVREPGDIIGKRRYLAYPAGHFMAVRSDTWTQAGGMNSSTFLYGEEALLAIRVRRLGHLVGTAGGVDVVHEGGHSTGGSGELGAKSLVELEHSTAARVIISRQPGLRRFLPLQLSLRTFWGAAYLVRSQKAQASAVFRGILSGLRAKEGKFIAPVLGREVGDVRLATVVVNWNTSDDAVRVASECLGFGAVSSSIVVDNSSSETELRKLSALPADVQQVRLSVNRGYAAGVNAGLIAAAGGGATHVVILNPDIQVDEKVLVRMAEELKSADIVGVRQVGEDGLEYETAAYLRGRLPSSVSLPGVASAVEVDIVSGAALGISISLVERVGFLDESYFHYKEEFDFCFRAKSAGARVVRVNDAVLVHSRGGSMSKRSARSLYLLTRNELLFVKRYGTAVEFARMVVSTARSTSRGDLDTHALVKWTTWFKAVRDGLYGRSGRL